MANQGPITNPPPLTGPLWTLPPSQSGTDPSQIPPLPNSTTNANPPPAQLSITTIKQKSQGLTSGWWVFVGCVGAMMLSNTPVAPAVAGLLAIALLFQLGNLLQEQGSSNPILKGITGK